MKGYVLFIFFVICLFGCKKSCITCVDQPLNFYKADSTLTILYDTSNHRYDTILSKIDSINQWGNLTVLHFCPGSAGYEAITGQVNYRFTYYNPALGRYMPCNDDQ
jgi:hypothetical protein